MADMIGKKLGAYQLLSVIGIGGMATVYRAVQTAMNREVAIKVLSIDPAHDPERTFARFQREAELLAKLQHVHILPVFDYGVEKNSAYLVMPFMPNGTLEDHIRKSPLSLMDVQRLFSQVASGLDYAHRQGIIHRDLKPSNVLLDASYNALLADFGLARLAKSSSSLTGTGHALGTPYYMSPEQVRGGELDSRSDLYALGVLLYEMLVGDVPFDADTPIAIAFKHVTEPPPSMRTKKPTLPSALDEIVRKALSKLREDRFQTATDMATALTDQVLLFMHETANKATTALIGGAAPALPTLSAEQRAEPALERKTTSGVRLPIAVETENPPKAKTPVPPRSPLTPPPGMLRGAMMPRITTPLTGIAPIDSRVRVLVSAHPANRAVADALVERLKKLYDVWTDRELVAGQHRQQEVTRQIQERNVYIALVSVESVLSKAWQDDLAEAVRSSRFIIPVLAGEYAVLPTKIEHLIPLDMRDGFYDEAFLELLRAIINRPITLTNLMFSATQSGGVSAEGSASESSGSNADLLFGDYGMFLAPPKPDHTLLGRDELLRTLKQRLASAKRIALSGLPGVGKSALLIQLVHDPEVRLAFPDGVLWVSLGLEPAVLPLLGKWGRALGVDADDLAVLDTVEARAEMLRDVLADRRCLLVIDDAWTAEDAFAFHLGGVDCVHILTTRKPDVALDFAGDVLPVRELSAADGMMLMQQFAPETVEAEPDKAFSLVQSVGALPLAIMLVAKHLNKTAKLGKSGRLTREIKKLERAEERLKIDAPQGALKRSTNLPEAQRISLEAVIAVSDDSLSDSARMALRALAVFPPKPNSFDETAALAVSGGAVEVLDALTDVGMIETIEAEYGTRYTLHQTIADYARAKLIDAAPYGRLMAHFSTFVELHRADYDLLALEYDNILAALNAAAQSSQPLEQGLTARLTNDLYRFWEANGFYDDAERHLQIAEAIAAQHGNARGQAQALLNWGRVAEKRGDLDAAEMRLKRGLALLSAASEEADLHVKVHLLTTLGMVAAYSGDDSTAGDHWEQALEVAEQLADHERIATLKMNLGLLRLYADDVDAAAQILNESLTIARVIGDDDIISHVLQNLGAIAADQEDYTAAQVYLDESMTIAQRLNNLERLSEVLLNLGELANRQGNLVAAEAHFRDALEIAIEIDNPAIASHVLENLGSLAETRGRLAEAQAYLREALDTARKRAKAAAVIVWLSKQLGLLYLQQGQFVEARAALNESLLQARLHNIQAVVAENLFTLARAAAGAGDHRDARAKASESVAAFIAAGDDEGAGRVGEWLRSYAAGS